MLGWFAAHSKLVDQIGINALLALSLSIGLRAGQLALAQAAFMGIAAYVGAIGAVEAHWNLPLAMLAGALAAAGVGAVLALPLARLRGVFLAIATIGFGEIARIVEINAKATGGAEGYANIPNDATTPWIYGTLAASGALLVVFARTKGALALAATREDESAARGVGIDVAVVRFATLVAGAAIAGCAGVLYAHANYFITPSDFGFGRMEQILVACVIGGVTSSLGAVIGAAAMTVLPELVRFLADYREVSTGAILLGIVLFAPDGIAGLWRRRT
ncbi:MAG: branched-chain amino acid ABC transporter permease [Vulcanimicrobiaceae bacterium]